MIGSISNGMDLLGLESDIKFIITGGVLLLAVTIDALARRDRASQRAERGSRARVMGRFRLRPPA